MKITSASVALLWESDFAPTRENRFVHTYLLWALLHFGAFPRPWPKELSWFELSLIANNILLQGMDATLRIIRKGEEIDMPHEQGSKGDEEIGRTLAEEYVLRTSRVWKRLYPVQWAQTTRTLRKLMKFDPHNTGHKLSDAGKHFQKVTVLQYPAMFCGELAKSKVE